MAESEVIVVDSSEDELSPCDSENQPTKPEKEKDPMECPICLQTCIHPARLPCGHIFCFLCVKGVAYKNRRCAMCRREIPPEFLEHPQLVHGVSKTKTTEDGYQWYYEGRNGGWWEYDSRTSSEIEDAFSQDHRKIDVLICGILYTINFKEMVQYRKDDKKCKRYIKRCERHCPVDTKGVAGISHGWWQYDERTSQDIEEAYKKGEKSCTILVAGYVYVVDFEAMLQQRQNDPSRRRHVKRDLASIPKKGVAGLRIEGSLDETESDPLLNPIVSSIERQNSNNFISPIAATDAAIRIATDIIDSTLAHADDSNRSEDRDQNGCGRGQRELLDDAEELLDASQGTSIVGASDHTDLFSQTLDDFRSLTLRNVVDSSDSEDDNEHIIL